jgi:uncharacterized protein (DUF1697 family)
MQEFVALLRAVNVGGTGILSMQRLVSMATKAGFDSARTYIQSGNLLFESALSPPKVQQRLEQALLEETGRKIGVVIRTASQLREVLASNPFPDQPGPKVAVIFFTKPVADDALDAIAGRAGEQVRLSGQELYIYYPEGMGKSKLKLPRTVLEGTARNMNTVSKLVRLCKAPV